MANKDNAKERTKPIFSVSPSGQVTLETSLDYETDTRVYELIISAKVCMITEHAPCETKPLSYYTVFIEITDVHVYGVQNKRNIAIGLYMGP